MQQHFLFTGDERADWRLDDHTKTAGREGVAAARAILQASHVQTPGQELARQELERRPMAA